VALSDIGVLFGEDAELARSKAAPVVKADLSQGLSISWVVLSFTM
jgi:hypothetical protein